MLHYRSAWPSDPLVIRVRDGLMLACLTAALVTTAGCEKDSGCRVSGTVTLDGAPLPDGVAMFLPDKSDPRLRTVSAVVTNGEFTAHLLPGKYRVAFTSDQPSGRKIEADLGTGVMIDEYVQVIPRKFNADTQLEVEIAGDRDDLEFTLTRK